MAWLRLVPLSVVLLTACNDADLVDPPPVQAAITLEQGSRRLPLEVRCTGPDDELALLGDLCGSVSELLGASRIEVPRGDGLATSVGNDARLLIFARVDGRPEHDDNIAGRLAYSAYVVLDASDLDGAVASLEQWQDGEAVTSGHVRTERAFIVACDGSAWAAEGSFVWRKTTLELAWTAGIPC